MKIFFIETYLNWRLKCFFRHRHNVLSIVSHFEKLPSSYKIAAEFQRSLGLDPYTYGHTPLWTIYQIFKDLRLKPQSQVLDLGAGDFQIPFFLNEVFKLKVFGIEKIPKFCLQANQIKSQFYKDDVIVLEGNYLELQLPKVDLAYLFGSNLSDDEIDRLIVKIENIPLVVTVSYPLSDYSKDYKTVKELNLPFLFGLTKVYINQKEGSWRF